MTISLKQITVGLILIILQSHNIHSQFYVYCVHCCIVLLWFLPSAFFVSRGDLKLHTYSCKYLDLYTCYHHKIISVIHLYYTIYFYRRKPCNAVTQYAPRTIEEKTKGEIQKSMVDLLSFMDKVTPRYMYYDQILYVCAGSYFTAQYLEKSIWFFLSLLTVKK